MSFTMTRTVSESFTLTHAKHLASKITADMKRCQQRYGLPHDQHINHYGTELALLLRDGYVSTYEFGFQNAADQRLVSWFYTVNSSGLITADERPGGIYSDAEISKGEFFNFLTKTTSWANLSLAERQRIEAELPVQRTPGKPPTDGYGYWVEDRTYSATGVAMIRKTFRPY